LLSTLDSPVMVGDSPSTSLVRTIISKLAKSRWPALLLGETGTGKEVAARSIHIMSGAPGPFVIIDCSCMGTLLESELFGHVKGAFTGASNTKVGLLESASGGTAFFDEIGELPLEAQAKLLRVLQEKEFRPLGALTTRRSDFRIIAATNRDLAAEVERGTFRRDLYFRLNVLTLRLVPLRERMEDIPSLLSHFLEIAGGQHTLTPEAIAVLLAYSWPGNVRELANCIQHMVVMSPDHQLTVQDLPATIRDSATVERRPPDVADSAQPNAAGSAPPSAVLSMIEIEKQAILNALEKSGGDRSAAANLLGIGRTTLFRRLKKYKVAGS
jgi:transcriptional regulator with PAS, ATPase and Fis domain